MGRPRKIRTVENRGETGKGRKITVDSPVTVQEAMFIDAYMETGDPKQAYERAGYTAKYSKKQVDKILALPNVAYEVKRRIYQMKRKSVASAEEVMEYFTNVMRGEVKDQFGLEAPLSERTRAAQEIAKRTIDIDNKLNNKEDNVIKIQLDWSRND